MDGSMSDRVTVIGGSEVGRDHFPVEDHYYLGRVTDLSGGVPSDKPFLWYLSAVDACYAFYVVRRWYFGVDISYTRGLPGPSQTSHTLGISFEFEWNVYSGPSLATVYRPTRESDLVQPRFGSSGDWEDRPDGTNSFDDNPDDFPNLSVFDYTSNNGHDTDDVLLTMSFGLGLINPQWRDDSLVVGLSYELSDGHSAAAARDTFPNNVGTLSVNMGSGLYSSKDVGMTASNIVASPYIKFTSVNVVISPNPVLGDNRFWPYAATDGTPIWGSRFGEQLQSPFN